MNENENLVVKKLYGLFNVSASKSRTTLILPLTTIKNEKTNIHPSHFDSKLL